MQILTGLFDRGVLQRDAKNKSSAAITGSSAATGSVLALVKSKTAKKKSLPTQAQKIGSASGGQFQALLKGLPAGGPYDIELSIVDSKGKTIEKTSVKNVLVGDLWIAGGQSNMQGCGLLPPVAKPDPMVRAFYMDDHWDVAKDPIHQLEIAVDFFHNNGKRSPTPDPKRIAGVGAAVDFAQEMHRLTGVPQGILACGHGGTSMTQWSPQLLDKGGASLYGASIRRLTKNGGRCAGVIWYQGCSDANAEAAPVFTQRMIELVNAFRRDARDRALPFVAVQLSRYVAQGETKDWNSIREQQRTMGSVIKNYSFVPAIDLELDDAIHIATRSQELLGKRLAYAMNVLKSGKKAGKPPITIKRAELKPLPLPQTLGVEIEFENVVGKLRSVGRANGFTVTDGGNFVAMHEVELDGNRVLLKTGRVVGDLNDPQVSYGQGFDPYCNIVDGANRSLPAFGPMAVGNPRASTPFVRQPRVRVVQPGAGKLEKIEHPENLDSLGLVTRTFPDRLCNLHEELQNVGSDDAVVYFAVDVEIPEPMKLNLILGYDGPIKAWLDGKQLFYDPQGTNPALPEKAIVPIHATPGLHKFLVALGANGGAAWGISMRFERVDLSKKTILSGPANYAMPKILG